MNNSTFTVFVTSQPEFKTTTNDFLMGVFLGEICDYNEERPSLPVVVRAWGSIAEQWEKESLMIGEEVKVTGSLRIEKKGPIELHVTNYHPKIVNAISLVGRAGKDPEIKYLNTGKTVAHFGLAVRRMNKDDGPDWFDLEIWGRTAHVAADHVKKGSLIGVTGTARYNTWKDKQTNEERGSVIIKVVRLELLGSRNREDS